MLAASQSAVAPAHSKTQATILHTQSRHVLSAAMLRRSRIGLHF
jgi:hypothetical protein